MRGRFALLLLVQPASAFFAPSIAAHPLPSAAPALRIKFPPVLVASEPSSSKRVLREQVEAFQRLHADRLEALRVDALERERDATESELALSMSETDVLEREDAVARAILQLDANELTATSTKQLAMRRCPPLPHWVEEAAEVVEKGTVPSLMLIAATVLSLTLANLPATSSAWLAVWSHHLGPAIGGHALSARAWINEGLMAVFFFVVGLEIKQELRLGSLASVRKALLPCLAAVGGMVTPMAVYLGCQALLPMPSLSALTVPMATDIAFAMGILGFFRSAMPLSASAFLLTLATVDDLGAILVLAVVFASNVSMPFLSAAAAICGLLALLGRRGSSDLRVFGAGGVGLWYCLLRAGVNSDVAGVLAAMCISTRAAIQLPSGRTERLTERAIRRISPFTAFVVMPLFALANTAVQLGGTAATSAAAATAAAAASAASVAPAVGIGAGLVLGKPLGIFGFTWLADKLGLAKLPTGMNLSHLGVVGMLGGIGFTMCLLLTEVALPSAMQTIPKLAVLSSSALAAIISAAAMARMPPAAEVKEA